MELDPRNPAKQFADHFKANAGLDADHYVDHAANILFAGLSHNSKNLTERNILNSMPGCRCDPPATSLEKCSCSAKPILEEHGQSLRYSMSKLKKEDLEWYTSIVGGGEWEILSCDMDIEEPEAAHTIALALNNKNKIAFATGHLEIMRTLKSLCKPDPTTMEVPWQRVQAAMAKTFGTCVLDEAYYHAFQLVAQSGGNASETWSEFFKWAGYFVDESKRMIRLDTYSTLAQYPHFFVTLLKCN